MNVYEAFCREASAGTVEHIVYAFDGFHLDVTRRRLASNGGVVLVLNSRAIDCLLLLVANAGQLVEKRRLMESVWPAAVVEDNKLNQCILAIRKALGETAGSNRYIMTVPGRGYCFVCPVQTRKHEAAETSSDLPASRARRFALTGAALAPVACLLLTGLLYSPESARTTPDTRSEPSLVLRLRAPQPGSQDHMAAAVSPAVLGDCLALEAELHLEVSVRLMRDGVDQPLWSGQYVAGRQDLLALQEPADSAGNACAALAASQRATEAR